MLTVTRHNKDNKETLGEAVYGDFKCCTLELPWKQNKQNVSCIPTGIHPCRKIISPSLGACFEIQDVPNRTFIRGHVANYTYQLRGCVAFGEVHADIDGDGVIDVTSSCKTFDALMAILPEEFMMEIV